MIKYCQKEKNTASFTMKLYAPKYYKDFACIADKCRHSCCIGWEIDIDNITLEKYRNLNHNYAEIINNNIDKDGAPHFQLAAHDRCPHLNSNGLCEIILNLGEDYLCDICREHPRFYNTVSDRREVGIGMACEEAGRIILTSDNYSVFAEVGEVCGESEESSFDTLVHRDKLYSILSDTALPYNEKLHIIYNEYRVSPSVLSDDEWQDVLSSLEYLDGAHKSLLSNYSSEVCTASEHEKILERALAYFIFRHCTEASDETDFRISLGFCLFCERLLASLLKSENAHNINDAVRFAQIISEEIEYSEDNTDSIKFEFSLLL